MYSAVSNKNQTTPFAQRRDFFVSDQGSCHGVAATFRANSLNPSTPCGKDEGSVVCRDVEVEGLHQLRMYVYEFDIV